jgi:hypothetical protein
MPFHLHLSLFIVSRVAVVIVVYLCLSSSLDRELLEVKAVSFVHISQGRCLLNEQTSTL